MARKVFIFYGPPGAGKGTQAAKIAEEFGYVHFDSGKYIEKFINDPKNKNSAVAKRERAKFMSGKLCTTSWLVRIVSKEVKELDHKNQGIVFSGSPRTKEEAFGADGEKGGLVRLLGKLYGLENIFVFFLDIPVEESVKRNSKRGRPGLDEPAVIRVRYREYRKMTFPIAKEMKKFGLKVIHIDGSPSVSAITKEVKKNLRDLGVKPSNS